MVSGNKAARQSATTLNRALEPSRTYQLDTMKTTSHESGIAQQIERGPREVRPIAKQIRRTNPNSGADFDQMGKRSSHTARIIAYNDQSDIGQDPVREITEPKGAYRICIVTGKGRIKKGLRTREVTSGSGRICLMQLTLKACKRARRKAFHDGLIPKNGDLATALIAIIRMELTPKSAARGGQEA